MRYRLEQIAACTVLILSLLVSTASACACSHHQPKPIASAEPSCHSHRHTPEPQKGEVDSGFTRVDEGCTCFVNQRSPVVVTKSAKEPRPSDKAVVSAACEIELDLTDVSVISNGPPVSSRATSYSSILRSLLPSRAPPRL